jgi:hypothetical protein
MAAGLAHAECPLTRGYRFVGDSWFRPYRAANLEQLLELPATTLAAIIGHADAGFTCASTRGTPEIGRLSWRTYSPAPRTLE